MLKIVYYECFGKIVCKYICIANLLNNKFFISHKLINVIILDINLHNVDFVFGVFY